MSELREALRHYDGRAVSMLSEIQVQFAHRSDFLSDLILLIGTTDGLISDGATWLIKDFLDHGGELDERAVTAMNQRLDLVSTWPSVLHLCQSARYISFTPEQAQQFGEWASSFVSHDRPFLRAWSMDALQHVSKIAVELSPAAETSLERARVDRAASVRARARKHVKSD